MKAGVQLATLGVFGAIIGVASIQRYECMGPCGETGDTAATPLSKRETTAEQGRIAFVDLQRVLNETVEGRSLQQRLRDRRTHRQRTLDRTRAHLLEERRRLQAAEVPVTAFEQRRRAYDEASDDLRATHARYEEKQPLERQGYAEQIFEQVKKLIRRIGRASSYPLVILSNENIAWGTHELDMTEEVIRRFDAQYGHGSETHRAETRSPR